MLFSVHIKFCKIICYGFSPKQCAFIIKHYYVFASLCDHFREVYIIKFPNSTVPSNTAIKRIIHKSEHKKKMWFTTSWIAKHAYTAIGAAGECRYGSHTNHIFPLFGTICWSFAYHNLQPVFHIGSQYKNSVMQEFKLPDYGKHVEFC